MENILDELATAYALTKAKPTAWELYELHKKRGLALRGYLIEELRTKPGEEVVINIEGATSVSDEDFLDILAALVNAKRRDEGKEPISIMY